MSENQNQNQQNLRLLGQQVIAGNKRFKVVDIDLTHIDPEYIGKFKFHHPTVIERMQIGVIKSQLLQGLEGRVDVITDNIAHMTATLEVVTDSSPEWFNVNNIYDYEVLDAVYEEYIKFYNSFRKPAKPSDNEGDSEGSSEQV